MSIDQDQLFYTGVQSVLGQVNRSMAWVARDHRSSRAPIEVGAGVCVREAAIAKSYHKGEGGQVLDAQGFFDTGDAARLDPQWDERAILLVVRRDGSEFGKEELLAFMRGEVADGWLPDDVVFVDEIPHTATGRIQKRTLRERFAAHSRSD